MRRIGLLALVTLTLAAGHASVAARDYADAADDVVRREAGAELGARVVELLPSVIDRPSGFEALIQLVQTRQEIIDALISVRRMTDMDGIKLADAIDDSLAYHAATLLQRFVEQVPEPLVTPGTEKYKAGLMRLGFVSEYVTGFLFHLELQQAALLLNEFRTARSPGEAEAAEDTFLRHFAELAALYRVQHVELRDLHLCNVANMEWTIGRFESESGTSDFYVAGQFFSSRDSGFAYFLKLASPTTGETVDVHYPLPHLTEMDEGWQQLQAEKAAKGEESGSN